MSKAAPEKPRRGRPPTGQTKEVTKVNLPLPIYLAAKRQANKVGESYSQFASRAIQLLLMNSQK